MTTAPSFDPEVLARANINPASYLATDYLNHFNEVVMLIEMAADMPDVFEDILAWEPLTYPQHFERSVFANRQLAIDAYDAAPGLARSALEDVIDEVNAVIMDLQVLFSGADASRPLDPAIAERIAQIIANDVRPRLDRASAIINAPVESVRCDEVRNAIAGMRAQDAVDELFA